MSTEPQPGTNSFTGMTDEQIHTLLAEVAEEAAEKAVQKTLLSVGMDVSTPAAVIRTQRAVDFMYQSQDMSSLIKKYGVGAIVTTVVGAALTMLWFGFQHYINKGP